LTTFPEANQLFHPGNRENRFFNLLAGQGSNQASYQAIFIQ